MKSGFVLLNKPKGKTSRDVVNRIVRCLHTGKVGHAGTLDPFAEGLLLVVWGKGTRLVPYLQQYTKTYVCDARFGIETDTQDYTGTVLRESNPSHLTAATISEALSAFRGDVRQVPPMFSAVRVNGKRLYEHAREGVVVARTPRTRQVHHFELATFESPVGSFRVTVESGTYVRTLVHDLGQHVGSGAVVTRLVRTAVGPHRLEDAVCYETLEKAEDLRGGTAALSDALPDWNAVTLVDSEEVRRVVTGSWMDPEKRLTEAGRYKLLDSTGELLALVRGGTPPQFLGVFGSGEKDR